MQKINERCNCNKAITQFPWNLRRVLGLLKPSFSFVMEPDAKLLAHLADWVHVEAGQPDDVRRLLAVYWWQCRQGKLDATIGPLVGARCRVQQPDDDMLHHSTAWRLHLLKALRVDECYDFAQAGKDATDTLHYQSFTRQLARVPRAVETGLLQNAFPLYAAAALQPQYAADVIAAVAGHEPDYTPQPGSLTHSVMGLLRATTRDADGYRADVGRLFGYVVEHQAARINQLTARGRPSSPPASRAGSDIRVTPSRHTEPAPAPAAPVPTVDPSHPEQCALEIMRNFKKRARLHYADGPTLRTAALVTLLSDNFDTVSRRLLPAFFGGGQRSGYAARVAERLTKIREAFHRQLVDTDWTALAWIVKCCAAGGETPASISAELGAFAVDAKRGPELRNSWDAGQALAAYVLCQHPNPDAVWHGAFELGRLKRAARQMIGQRQMRRQRPAIPDAMLESAVRPRPRSVNPDD
jgi:hypothetical protein